MDETTVTCSNIPDHRADHTPSPSDSSELEGIIEAYSQLKMRLKHYRQTFHRDGRILAAIDKVVKEISDVEELGLSEEYQTCPPTFPNQPTFQYIRKSLILSCNTAIAIYQFDGGYKTISSRFQSKFRKARDEIEQLLLLLKR